MSDVVREQLVELGAITRPQGIRGELRLHAFNPESDLLLSLRSAFLIGAETDDKSEAAPQAITIRSVRRAPKAFILSIAGVSDRDAAEALRGKLLAVPREALPPAGEDEFYLIDLEGLRVLQGDREIGVVERVLEYPSIECLEVEIEAGVVEIPLVEPWTLSIDLEEGVVQVGDLDDLPVRR